MTVTLVGIGCGTGHTMTGQGLDALREAEYIVGAARLLERLPAGCTERRTAAAKPSEIAALLEQSGCTRCCVVYSGDTGFYSGARSILPLLRERDMEVQVLPGISSVQYFSAKLGCPWQNWDLYSAHGVYCDAVAAVCQGKPAFFLTGGTLGPAALCRQLVDAGLGRLQVTVGENLSYENERIRIGTAEEFSHQEFAPLSVLLAEAAPICPPRAPGIPDEAFQRGKVPMTKQEVRTAILAKLAVGPNDVCWDIGAGTGSVSVELALQAKSVWAVENKPEACELVRANRDRFCAWRLRLVEGEAPDVLAGLPRPDAVFIGGSGGKLAEILQYAAEANPRARVCVSAIALETMSQAAERLNGLGYEVEIVQIGVSRAKAAGSLHLLMAQNPVFLITGVKR